MATGISAYPSGTDTFEVPNAASTTPLSQAGTGNSRNHVTHHADMGAAIMALQANVTKTTHTHDGTGINGPQLSQANTHLSPDTDGSITSLHHTIDPTQSSATKAAAANHNHNSSYVDFNSDQGIPGKKTFAYDNAHAIVIPNYINAQHNHLGPNQGGIASTGGFYWTRNAPSNGPASRTISANSTQDFFIGNQGFTIPANMACVGTIYVSSLLYNSATNSHHSAMMFHYLSLNQPGDPGIWISNKNILVSGGSYNGVMVEADYTFGANAGGSSTQQQRFNMPLGFVIPATNADRTGCRLGMRLINADNQNMIEVNWGGYLTFMFTATLS